MARNANAQRPQDDQATSLVEPTNANTEVTTTEVAGAKGKIEEVDVTACGDNKSAKMRTYLAAGFTVGEVAKHMGVKYQFVRNVKIQEIARNAA